MNRHWLPKLILLLALVFAQALYAGHAVQHTNGGSVSDCSVCQLASAGNDIQSVAQIHFSVTTDTQFYSSQPVQTCFTKKTSYTQHSRAPPIPLY